MAVCRIEKTKNYTVMSNYHLRDKRLSLKAAGLLSVMLSLPEDWDYTTRGLASICKDGVDAISAALKELEHCGYLVRRRIRDSKGRMRDTEYIIYETPQPDMVLPDTENPDLDTPDTENAAQRNIDKNKYQKKLNTDVSSTDSFPFRSDPPMQSAVYQPEPKRREPKSGEMETYREIIRENIGYEILLQDYPRDRERIDEVVELLAETVCSSRRSIRVGGNDYPAEVVKSRFLKLNCEHIRFVFDCMRENTTKIRNIRQYLLTTLFNAPVTIGNYYSARVNHDLYGDSV